MTHANLWERWAGLVGFGLGLAGLVLEMVFGQLRVGLGNLGR